MKAISVFSGRSKTKYVRFILSFLLPAIAGAAVLDGAHFRLSGETLVIDRVAVGGAAHLNAKSDALQTTFLDYWVRLGSCRVFVREGHINLIDPESMDASIDFSHEEEKGGFKVFTMVSHDKTEAAASVMIRPIRGSDRMSEDPGVYFSVRAKDVRQLRDGFVRLVLEAELRTSLLDYRKINECEFSSALDPLAKFLAERCSAPSAIEPVTR